MSDDYRAYVALRQVITERLSESDLNLLCFDIGLDYDDLGGDSKPEKVVELLQDIRRRNMLARLIEAGQRLRADIGWDEIIAVTAAVVAAPPAPAAPPNAAPREADQAWEEKLLATLGPFARDGIFFRPRMPPRKAENAARACEIPEGEIVLVLVDCTLDGSSNFGGVFGRDAFYYKNDLSGPEAGPGLVRYDEFPERDFARLGIWQVTLGRGQVVNMAGSGIKQQHLADMLSAVKLLVLGR